MTSNFFSTFKGNQPSVTRYSICSKFCTENYQGDSLELEYTCEFLKLEAIASLHLWLDFRLNLDRDRGIGYDDDRYLANDNHFELNWRRDCD